MKYIFTILLTILIILSFEKIKLSWELNKLYFNNQNLKIEYEILKEENLKLLTQFHLENLPSGIEKQAKENLGMIKKEAKEILDVEKVIASIILVDDLRIQKN